MTNPALAILAFLAVSAIVADDVVRRKWQGRWHPMVSLLFTLAASAGLWFLIGWAILALLSRIK